MEGAARSTHWKLESAAKLSGIHSDSDALVVSTFRRSAPPEAKWVMHLLVPFPLLTLLLAVVTHHRRHPEDPLDDPAS